MKQICKICQIEVDAIVTMMPETSIHRAKATCPQCDTFLRWIKKPENENRRTKTSKYTLDDIGIDYCEFCGRTRDNLGNRETLSIHHKKWIEDGGPDERWNIMVLCSACHSLASWMRTYFRIHLNDFHTNYVRVSK